MSDLLKLSDFDFHLPEELIALRPAAPRRNARMLKYSAGKIEDGYFFQLANSLEKGDRLVINDTQVIPARLKGKRIRKDTVEGGMASVEVTLLRQKCTVEWSALIKPLKKVEIGDQIVFGDGFTAILLEKTEGQAKLSFDIEPSLFHKALETFGEMPLPPYITAKRLVDPKDSKDYQTIFAQNIGSVAAPTASLHFDETVLHYLSEKGVEVSFVTLHVGVGTFLPVKVNDVKKHKMHAEFGEVGDQTALDILQTRKNGGRIIPVGTTALRLIETAALRKGYIEPWRGETDIFIYPGFEFKVTDALITNFHLPRSTLLMLVAAFIGLEEAKKLYKHAVASRYRFFSYGDASFLAPNR